MKPSRIIKSAHAAGGKKQPLKCFARELLTGPDARLAAAAKSWLGHTKRGDKPRELFTPRLGPGPTEADIHAYKARRNEVV